MNWTCCTSKGRLGCAECITHQFEGVLRTWDSVFSLSLQFRIAGRCTMMIRHRMPSVNCVDAYTATARYISLRYASALHEINENQRQIFVRCDSRVPNINFRLLFSSSLFEFILFHFVAPTPADFDWKKMKKKQHIDWWSFNQTHVQSIGRSLRRHTHTRTQCCGDLKHIFFPWKLSSFRLRAASRCFFSSSLFSLFYSASMHGQSKLTTKKCTVCVCLRTAIVVVGRYKKCSTCARAPKDVCYRFWWFILFLTIFSLSHSLSRRSSFILFCPV